VDIGTSASVQDKIVRATSALVAGDQPAKAETFEPFSRSLTSASPQPVASTTGSIGEVAEGIERSRVRRSRSDPKLRAKVVDIGTSASVQDKIVRATLAFVADDAVPPVETLPATVGLGNSAVGIDVPSELILAASRLDSLSSA
jgi:hypothetical protein